MAQLAYVRDWGGQFIVPIPRCRCGMTGRCSERTVVPAWKGASAVKVVLFCGGMGMRLREHSEALPKPIVRSATVRSSGT